MKAKIPIAVGDRFAMYNKGGGQIVWRVLKIDPAASWPRWNLTYVPDGAVPDAAGKYNSIGFINSEVLAGYFADRSAKKL